MTLTTTHTPGSADVVAILTAQHEHVKTLMTKVLATSGAERHEAFDQVRYTLAAHEAAEAEVLHPLARADVPAGDDAVVTDRLAEEDEAGAAITKLERLDVDTEEFTAGFRALQEAVIAHAEAEEHQELPAITAAIDANQEQQIAVALAQVDDLARVGPLTVNGDSFASMLQTAREHFHRSVTPAPAPATAPATAPAKAP
jgi:hemerythrin superfamily protein